ncbi:MAG TPA: GGDEF domain-containing protein [Verrucomicrobiae bacterium]|nr:GGDEF domain-containing protein [Verrucomicrobiae bacterium]
MFKRILIFIIFLMALPVLYFKAEELSLAYYALSSFMLLPMFYLYSERAIFLFRSSVAIFVICELYFLARFTEFEMLFLLVGHLGALGALIVYRRTWLYQLKLETDRNEELLRSWEMLKHKHQNRLENLQHLEKQAASLMDLFEMARDFSESLNYDVLAELIYKRVRPELPFQEMSLILNAEESKEALKPFRRYAITEKGVAFDDFEPPEPERNLMQKALEEKRLQLVDSKWLFPLAIENDVLAYLSVAGADQGDLAKFEVLVSHLVLQIKKIRLYETVRELSIVDSLTQVFVRRHCMDLFESELKRSMKHGFSLALLMLDIDHFKRYNDDFGHLVGDATLREVAAVLRSNLRKVDIVARYGGEEFLVIIPETGARGALEAAERIRSSIARHTFKVYDVVTKVTVSAGVAVYPQGTEKMPVNSEPGTLMRELIHQSDLALYRAKEEGRNRVVRYQDL